MKPFYIEGTSISDCWFQLLWNIFDFGRKEIVDKGSYQGITRLEYDWVVCRIKYPRIRPLSIQMPEGAGLPPPNDEATINKYFVDYILSDKKSSDEDYSYGERLNEFDQINNVINTYRKYGHRNNQMVLQIARPSDILLEDPPCLRAVDTRVQDNKLHFYPYFRSNDLWNAWGTNIGGIQLLKEYMAEAIGVEDGEILYSSKGLHLYEFSEEIAKMRICRSDLEM